MPDYTWAWVWCYHLNMCTRSYQSPLKSTAPHQTSPQPQLSEAKGQTVMKKDAMAPEEGFEPPTIRTQQSDSAGVFTSPEHPNSAKYQSGPASAADPHRPQRDSNPRATSGSSGRPEHSPPSLNIPSAPSTTSLPPPDPAAADPAAQRTSELLRRAAALIDGIVNTAVYMQPIPASAFAVANELRARALPLERGAELAAEVSHPCDFCDGAIALLRKIGEVRS
jgi:hypothetical protein